MAKDTNSESVFPHRLQKFVVYVPYDEKGLVAEPPITQPEGAASDCAEPSDKPGIPRSDAALRTANKRVERAAQGLIQMNIVVKDKDDIRVEIAALAKRTVNANDWAEVIAGDPIVKALNRSLSSMETRLLRIKDLEERHRNARVAVVFHGYAVHAKGYRRFLLYLAGFAPTPFAPKRPND